MDRREILKLFGITAVAATVPAVAEAARPPLKMWGPPAFPAPPGMTYQWKRIFITSDEPDLAHILEMVKSGWKPVPAGRHPEVRGDPAAYWIEHAGLVLMEKPTKDIPPPVAYPVPGDQSVGYVVHDAEGNEVDAFDTP